MEPKQERFDLAQLAASRDNTSRFSLARLAGDESINLSLAVPAKLNFLSPPKREAVEQGGNLPFKKSIVDSAGVISQGLPTNPISLVSTAGRLSGSLGGKDLVRDIAQGVAQDIPSTIATVGKRLGFVDPSFVFTPRTPFEKTIFGPEPFSYEKSAEELAPLAEKVGISKSGFEETTPLIFAGLTALDWVTIPGKRKAILKAIINVTDTDDAAKVLRNAGLSDEVIFGLNLPNRAVNAKTTEEAEKILTESARTIARGGQSVSSTARSLTQKPRQFSDIQPSGSGINQVFPPVSARKAEDGKFSLADTVAKSKQKRDVFKSTPATQTVTRKTTETVDQRDLPPPESLAEAMERSNTFEEWVANWRRLPPEIKQVYAMKRDTPVSDQLQRAFETSKGRPINPEEPADSVLSYVTPTGEKLVTPITKGELVNVVDEVANIPPRQNLSFGQIHLDANATKVRNAKNVREVSREEFLMNNPEAAAVVRQLESNPTGVADPKSPKQAAQAIESDHNRVAARYSGTDPKNNGESIAHKYIEGESEIKNVATKADAYRRGFNTVRSYVKKDGTVVAKHQRRMPGGGGTIAGAAGGAFFGGVAEAQAFEDEEGNYVFNPLWMIGGALAGAAGVKYRKRLTAAFKNPAKPLPPGPGAPIQLPPSTFFQRSIQKLQDQAQRLGFLQKTLRERGVEIPEEMDAYLQQEAYVGRAASAIGEMHDYLGLKATRKEGLFNRMRQDNINIDDLGEYMAAKNAKARNARVAKLTDGKILNGSGLTNKQAEAILKKYEGNEDIAYYASEFRENIIESRLHVLRSYGLYNEDQIAKITAGEPDYVPAKVMQDGFTGTGASGIDARGKAIKGLKGSSRTDRTNPVIQAVADMETTIIQAEKNRTLQSLKKLIEANPDKNFWEVKGIRSIPQYDEAGELQVFRQVRSNNPNTVSVWENGKEFEISFKDQDLADVFTKNSEVKMTLGWLRATNNYLRAVNTFMAPEFMVTNAIRDLQTAVVTAGGEKGAVTAAKMVRDTPSALRGIWKSLRKEGADDEWAKIYEEMRAAGGETGWFDVMTVEEQTIKTAKLIERYNSKQTSKRLARTIDSVGQLIRDANTATEMGIRVSAYKQLIDAGLSPTQAANYAKNMTVNFNKHGNWGIMLNSLYLFANAGIQGSARLITALRYKGVRRSVYGIAASAYALNEINEIVNPEGYERIQDFEKERSLIIMLPMSGNKLDLPGIEGSAEEGYYLKIPLPYGFNVFKVAGDAAYEVVNEKKTPTEAMKKMILSVDAAYNPLSSGTPIQTISPTITDPFVALWENKNWFGAPIMPEQPAFAPPVRDSDRYFKGARDMSVSVSEYLNRITGGNEVTAGAIDISPETIDHMIDTLGGSLGNFIAQTLNGIIQTASGDVPEMTELPFVRKFIDQPYEVGEQSTVFELLDESATKRLDPIQVRRFADNAQRAYEMGQIDASTLKRVTEQFIDNTTDQYAGEIISLAKENNLAEAYQVLESAPPNITERLQRLVKKEIEQAIERLQE